jgi:hypothetical protein
MNMRTQADIASAMTNFAQNPNECRAVDARGLHWLQCDIVNIAVNELEGLLVRAS